MYEYSDKSFTKKFSPNINFPSTQSSLQRIPHKLVWSGNKPLQHVPAMQAVGGLEGVVHEWRTCAGGTAQCGSMSGHIPSRARRGVEAGWKGQRYTPHPVAKLVYLYRHQRVRWNLNVPFSICFGGASDEGQGWFVIPLCFILCVHVLWAHTGLMCE